MRFLTGHFCCVNPRNVLVLQQVAGKAKRSVLLAVLWEEDVGIDGMGSSADGVMQIWQKWFYESVLQVCAKGKTAGCVESVRKDFCRKITEVRGHFAVLFAVEGECFYAWRGRAEIHLLNLCFNRLHSKRLTYLTEEVCVVRAQIEKGVGLLLGNESFLSNLPKQALRECLAVETLRSNAQIDRHLREVAEAAGQAGAKTPTAILVVSEKYDDTNLPASCNQLLADSGYAVEKWLGGGRFGRVYQVRKFQNNQVLACKMAGGFAEQSILRQEAMLQGSITHPLFAKYIDCLEGQECTMLLMEYLEGENLAKCLEKHIFSQRQAVDVVMQLAEGIGYLHELKEPVLYRDLKPEHVCLTKAGRVRLMDLGCACEISKAGLSKAGSPGYAPAEQLGKVGAQRNGVAPGFCSDVYALGKLLHYMLTGDNPCKPPYQKPPIRTYNQKLSPLLEQVIMQCVEINPKLRIPDMKCLMQRLKPFV